MDSILEVFRCPICIDFAVNAVSTSCCQQVFCRACIEGIPAPKLCPMCRSDNRVVQFSEATAVQRALSRLPVECPRKCGVENLKRGDLLLHNSTCPKKITQCPCLGCKWLPSTADTLPLHIATVHSAILMNRASLLFEDRLSALSLSRDAPPVKEGVDRRIEAITSNGRHTRIGTSGMRYCGGALPPSGCGCCNGMCGPSTGCACANCMSIEINLRKLPRGWLINRAGASCRRGTTGKWYCGRKHPALEHSLHVCDGWCGPTNGPQCPECAVLERLAPLWYQDV